MREHNIFAQSYQMMNEAIKDQEKLLSNSNDGYRSTPEIQLLFNLKPGMDERRFNLQRSNEVAAVFTTTADGEIPRVLRCNKKYSYKNIKIC